MSAMFAAIISGIVLLINLYIYVLIASAVFSWFVAFNVVNTRNQVVHTIGEFLWRATEPALRPIRRVLPNLGGLDISPVILVIILIVIQRFLVWQFLYGM
ncbi:MAG: YggT family protein [Rhodobiaceae bacterium]|nr:YggT family protein [Rhodobiaceae bacterium]